MRGLLPRLRRELVPDVVIANAENIAGGAGLTAETCEDMLSLGIDVLTSGNHVWDRREIISYIDTQPRLLRPLNLVEGTPGRGLVVLESCGLLVINLQGRVFMRPLDDPFRAMDRVLEDHPSRFSFVDFHAEATAEKKAMGFYLDGRVSAMVGTHTHVATADEQILPNGTGFITDVGMTGPVLSIIGNEPESTLRRYITQMPGGSRPAGGAASLNGIVLDVDDDSGHTVHIERVHRPWPHE